MQEQEMLDLIRRYLSAECTPDERKRVEDWLAEDARHREYFNAVKKIWDVSPSHDVDVDFDEEWRRISWRLGIGLDEAEGQTDQSSSTSSHNIVERSKDNPIKHLLRVAAVILLIAFPVYYFTGIGDNAETGTAQTEVEMQQIETAHGERASMEFSDGSKITLNSMSSVRFPKVFSGSKREIYLEGEAFFRVSHNEDVPFIVHSNGVDVRVLGTEFNINGHKQAGAVEVVVRDGKVAVKQNELNSTSGTADQKGEQAAEVILTQGQKTLVESGALPMQPQKVSLSPYLAWVNGEMIFEGTPMREVIPRLERAYKLTFEVQDSTLLSERLKASFKREAPEKVLGIIAFSLGIDYELHGDTVIFKSKNTGNTQ